MPVVANYLKGLLHKTKNMKGCWDLLYIKVERILNELKVLCSTNSPTPSEALLPDPKLPSRSSASPPPLSDSEATSIQASSPAPSVEEVEAYPSTTHKRTRSTITVASSSERSLQSGSDADTEAFSVPTLTKRRRQKKRARQASCSRDKRDADGHLKDIHVQSINDASERKVSPTKDCDAFFGSIYTKNTNKGVKNYRQCSRCKTERVADISTLRRHIELEHKAQYHLWCKTNDFKSKLPGDVKFEKDALAQAKHEQSILDPHLHPVPKEEVVIYEDEAWLDLAIKWLVETNQPINALGNARFRDMIHMASKAKNGVNIPSVQRTRREILCAYKVTMQKLRDDLNKGTIGAINLTCDGWQALTSDGYFAVTGHCVEELKPGVWVLNHNLLGFVQVNNSHNGERLGQTLFDVVDRLSIAAKVGHITCDNASNNNTMMVEFEKRVKAKNPTFSAQKNRIACFAHVINLAVQAMLSAYSKTPHYEPDDPEAHINGAVQSRDEVGLIRAITVKARSSAARKQLFKDIQAEVQKGSTDTPNVTDEDIEALMLLLDMKMRWSSTAVMLERAVSLREEVDKFIHELAWKEKNSVKQAQLASLCLSDEEWERASKFLNLLGYADDAQQSCSSETTTTLYRVFPSLQRLKNCWGERLESPKYLHFTEALQAGIDKINEYDDKAWESDALILSIALHPERRTKSFSTLWNKKDAAAAEARVQKLFEERYEKLNTAPKEAISLKKKSKFRSFVIHSDSEGDNLSEKEVLPDSNNKPWLAEYHRYNDTPEKLPEDMDIITWWGANAARYPVWASLARDYLFIMATSVSSERTFSAAGIIITKRRNRLLPDIIEALLFLKTEFRKELLFRERTHSCMETKVELSAQLDTSNSSGQEVDSLDPVFAQLRVKDYGDDCLDIAE